MVPSKAHVSVIDIVKCIPILIAAAIAAVVLMFPGKAFAHPYNAPQLGEFKPASAGSPMFRTYFDHSTGNWAAEFAAASYVRYNAEVKIVVCNNGVFSERINGSLFSGVDGTMSSSNTARLRGVGDYPQLSQSVVLRANGIKPDQHFAVRARWFPGGEYVTLASWKGDKPLMCGDLNAQYGGKD